MSQNFEPQKTLPEICIDFFSFIIQLKVTKKYGDYETLFNKVRAILDSIDHTSQRNDIPPKDVEDAKYALCALFDQMILTSDCPFKGEWAARPLELTFFGKNVAGVEFFSKLEEIKLQLETRSGVVEVYYYCLIHGFQGKYRIDGAERLKLLTNNLAFDLKRLQEGTYDRLSLSWELPQTLMQKVTTEVPPWVVSVAALLIVFVVFLLLNSFIGETSGNLVSELQGIYLNL